MSLGRDANYLPSAAKAVNVENACGTAEAVPSRLLVAALSAHRQECLCYGSVLRIHFALTW